VVRGDDQEAAKQKEFSIMLAGATITTVVAMGLNFLQTAVVFAAVKEDTNQDSVWPTDVEYAFQVPEALFDFSFLNMGCLRSSVEDEFATSTTLFANLIPLFVITLTLLIVGLSKVAPPAHRVPLGCGICFLLTSFESFSVLVVNNAINFAFQTYPHPDSEVGSLSKFPWLLTESDSAAAVKSLSLVFMFIWCAGYYISFGGLISKLRGSTALDGAMLKQITKMLFIKYANGYQWWPLVVVTRKLLVALGPSVSPGVSSHNLMFMCFVLTMFGAVNVHVQPYRFRILNNMESGTVFGQVMILLGALAKNSDAGDTPTLAIVVRLFVYLNYVLIAVGLGFAFNKFVLVRQALSRGDAVAGMQTITPVHHQGGGMLMGIDSSDLAQLNHRLGELPVRDLDALWTATKALEKRDDRKPLSFILEASCTA
jgi:hypothetical protein